MWPVLRIDIRTASTPIGRRRVPARPKSDHERRLAELREKHPRAYQPWNDEEDARLLQLVAEGADVKDIATALERQRTAITSRIEKLQAGAAV